MATLPPPPLTIKQFFCNCGVSMNSLSQKQVKQGFEKMVMGTRSSVGECSQNFSSIHRGLNFKIFAAAGVPLQKAENIFSTSTQVDELKKVSTYLFRTQLGGHVKVFVIKKNYNYVVCIEVSLELGTSNNALMLLWGIYRSDSSCFMPLDSQNLDPETTVTPLALNSLDRFAVEMEFEAKQSPFYLSFFLKYASSGSEIRNHRDRNFCVPIGFSSGKPYPLGLSFSSDGSMNFAFFSRNPEGVVLCLYNDSTTNEPALELDLDPYVNRSGDVWHASLEDAWTFTSYGYRCKGKGDGDRVLLDPYARILVNSIANHGSRLLPEYLGRLCKEPTFEWSGDLNPNMAMEKLIVYRLNVKRFTQHKSSKVYNDIAGTFAGVTEKLDHFKNLGVNAVLLEPIFPFDEQKGPYFPRHFFSPSDLYGPSGGGSISTISSMKEMVKELHANGIEVFLEVVFTHTALNCNFPIVQRMILDSLQYWVTEFHIDGFCFINASSLLRGFNGEYLSRPPLVEAIAFDPILAKTKLIADFWDPDDLMMPKETTFPHWKRWAEVNKEFCFDVRNFLRGKSLLSDLATRLCGSGDIFSSGRGPAFSFNFIARNSGLPLVDLVSFSDEEEVVASEMSWNCGEEGATNKTLILERRLKQIRNYLFILYVSLGVPVLNMGDECGESSRGSVSYRDRKPFDWNALSTGFATQMTQFISYLSSLRARRNDLFQKRNFLKEEIIDWYGNDGSSPSWEDPSCKFLAVTLKTDEAESKISSESSNGDIYMAFNAGGHSEIVILPPLPEGMAWHRLIDTALPFPGFFKDKCEEAVPEQIEGLIPYQMKSHSCTLFEATNLDV